MTEKQNKSDVRARKTDVDPSPQEAVREILRFVL